jgi:hypothetical protein
MPGVPSFAEPGTRGLDVHPHRPCQMDRERVERVASSEAPDRCPLG